MTHDKDLPIWAKGVDPLSNWTKRTTSHSGEKNPHRNALNRLERALLSFFFVSPTHQLK